MATPQVSGSNYIRSSTTTASVDISGVAVGNWMIISVMSSQTGAVVTEPAGWTRLRNGTTSGTRRNFVFGKMKELSDGTAAVFTQSSGMDIVYGLIWGIGAADIFTWTVGTPWTRGSDSAQPVGGRYDTIAPSITTAYDESLIVAIANEATLAQVQTNEVTAVNPGTWTERLWLPQIAPNDNIETVWIGTKELATVGATGDVTLTYSSPQDNNGFGIQIAIPPSGEIPNAPYVVGATSTVYVSSASTTFTIDRPAGAAAGDYLVVVVRSQHTNMSVEPASAGFTRLGPAFLPSDTSMRANGLYGRPIPSLGAEPTSYTFTITTGSSARLIAGAFLVRGVDLADPLAGFTNSYGGTIITGGRSVSGHTLASVPALTIFYGGSEFASPNDHVPLTTPAGFTPVLNYVSSTLLTGSRTYFWVGTKETAQFMTSTESITWGTPAGYAAESISLRGLSGNAPPEEGEGYNSFDGNGDAVKVYYKTPTSVRTPTQVLPMRPGFASVTEMLATPGFTWAHRGGSSSWPEMSLHAYTQAVAKGYGVLEVSMGRTSDGVWFGLHDQSTDRTSGGTYGNASSQTWAQVQAQQIVIGAADAPQPYMRWEEIVEAYGNSHIIVADPKYALGSFREEFLDLVENSVGTERAIIKYSGPGSGAAFLSTQAQARGFQTWGFFYIGDASAGLGGNGALQTWGPSWTIIGMEHGASNAVWNEVLALGKPTVGHIASSQAHYNAAIAKGASGVQVSGVGVVDAVSWWTQRKYPSIVGVTTSSRTGSGTLEVTLPTATGGAYMILLVGDNAPTQPSTPAGWTLVNWSTGNTALNMGIYAAPAGTAAPTFTLTQPHDGGFVATAMRFDADVVDITGSGGNNTLTSTSMVATKPGLMVWSLSGSLNQPPPATYTYPAEAPRWRTNIVSGGTEGGVALGIASAIVPAAGTINSVTWGLDNQSTTRAGGFFITLPDDEDN